MFQIHFAPLQGYTDSIYRLIHLTSVGGVDAYYTPFLRLEKGSVRAKDARDLVAVPGMRLIPQIIAKDADEFCKLADFVTERGFKELDVNMGCPFPMQTNAGRGAGILPRVDAVASIFECFCKYDLKISVKMRLGLENRDEAFALLPLLNETELSHITLHPRLGMQQYRGFVDMQGFEEFYEACKHPLIYNGDIKNLEQIYKLRARFPKLLGAMLGRGLLARPSLAAEFKENCEWAREKRNELMQKMHDEFLQRISKVLQGDSQILMRLHTFWEYQQEQLPKKMFKKMQKARSLQDYLSSFQPQSL